MKVSIVVPFDSSSDGHRERSWRWLRRRYSELHPRWELVEAACPVDEWSKGAAVNAGVEQADGDVLVIADADSYVEPEILTLAVTKIRNGQPWVVPHTFVYRLNEPASQHVVGGGKPRRGNVVRPRYEGPAGGGITVLTREAFETVNGIDERFLGWGGEDIAFGLALEALAGPPVRLQGQLIHLWHPHPAPSLRGSPESEELVATYQRARGLPRFMRAVVDRQELPERVRLERPVRFHSERYDRIVRIGDARIRFRNHFADVDDLDLVEALRLYPHVREVTDGVRNHH